MLARAEEEKQVVPGAELEVRFFQFFYPTSKRKRDRSPSLFLDLRLCFSLLPFLRILLSRADSNVFLFAGA